MTTALKLPDTFNPETYLISKRTENGLFHESRAGASFAEQLLSNGTPEDIDLAHQVLDATLNCQELHQDDPHYGNFTWMAEDDVVDDLNAVQFILERLIPMMIRHRNLLSDAMQNRVLTAIRLGLDEIRRLDVSVAYSNITALDIVNTCLGGELLDDADIANRGYQKLIDWMAFTDQYGTFREANSPTYTRVIINALKRIIDLVEHNPTRIRAETLVARLGISVALHIHRGTGRWAGPHSRAYHPTVVAETAPEIELIQEWLAEGHLPSWVADLLEYPQEPFEITETADSSVQGAITSYLSDSFCLGLSSREYGDQSNALIAHYVREGAERPGIMYTRYLMNDKWLGDFYHATDRTKSRNLIEEGKFYGIQQGARAIALYTPQNMRHCASAKATFIFTQREYIDEIWIGEQRINSLPASISEGQTIVIGSGDVYIAIRPLTRTDKGRNAPIRLVEKEDDLVLEIYNYLGSEKRFWELQPEWSFFQGYPQCGVYIEIANRQDYPDGKVLIDSINQGSLTDSTEAPFTYDGKSKRLWTIEYERDGQTIGIEVDLMRWEMQHRWTQAGNLPWYMLESPIAKQNRSGEVRVDDAILTCGKESAWLYANPDTKRWVAGYHGQEAMPIKLSLPDVDIEIEKMGTGTILWDNGELSINAIGLEGEPRITHR